MAIPDNAVIIAQTKKWIIDVVVGCGFCPFASTEIKRASISYEIVQNATMASALKAMISVLHQLDTNENIETSLLILPENFDSFDEYLGLIELADSLLAKENYEGVYQIASFHPRYLFAGSSEDDAANYTNRSPYPMLHFLREASVTNAVDNYPDIDEVPRRNIRFTNEKGLTYMQELLNGCMNPVQD
jgi:hypothetical protein